MIYKIKHSLVLGLFYIFSAHQLISDESANSNSYTDIVYFKDKVIAVGADGRIDCITLSGEIIPVGHSSSGKLNTAYANDESFIAVGEHGAILYSIDGVHFHHTESRTDKNINGIAFKNGLIIAGAESGLLLASKDGKTWNFIETKAKGNILSLSSNKSFYIGVTDAGEIIKSTDGIDWEVMDYNRTYAGYNPHVDFTKVLANESSVVIIGIHDDGSPSILVSSLGNVWSERWPIYHDEDGMICSLTSKPNDIAYDFDGDQFILACDNGILLSLPGCAKCNKYIKISNDDLGAILYIKNNLIVTGDNDSLFIQKF